jgi:hypothetical protein
MAIEANAVKTNPFLEGNQGRAFILNTELEGNISKVNNKGCVSDELRPNALPCFLVCRRTPVLCVAAGRELRIFTKECGMEASLTP